jgi:hypothetical protein
MATTYVYATTSTDVPVNLALQKLGPVDLNAKLDQTQLPASASKVRILEIPRLLDPYLYDLDIPLALARPNDAEYLVSLQILLRGHGPGSMIWWRWRRAAAEVGEWVTDHDPHTVNCADPTNRYAFTIQGVGTIGYDDIDITLARV